MVNKSLAKTALLRNPDGTIYHLNLAPGELATNIILVGDQNRVETVSQHFDQIDIKKNKREFVTHTGTFQGKRISVVSTGIGTDNIDIVLNECDALHNVDFDKAKVKDNITSLNFLRMGTCGGIGDQVQVGAYVLSSFAVGFDSLMSFYEYTHTAEEEALRKRLKVHFKSLTAFEHSYCAKRSAKFAKRFEDFCELGITLTCPGFYGPQYRTMRSPLIKESILSLANTFESDYGRICNMEMESSGIYALSQLLGHHACSVSLVVDNPFTEKVCSNMHRSMNEMIKTLLPLI